MTTIEIGDFKQKRYEELALGLRRVLMEYANDNHLTLVEAMGLYEVAKLSMYIEQTAGEMDEG